MANKANRYALARLRRELVLLKGYHPADVAHLVPLPQVRREKSAFELNVGKCVAYAKTLNLTLPSYRRATTKVKRIRRVMRQHMRWLTSLTPAERSQLIDDLGQEAFGIVEKGPILA